MTLPLKALKIANKAYKAYRKKRNKRPITKSMEKRTTNQMIKMANTKSQSKALGPVNRAIKRAKKIKDPVVREYGLDNLKAKRSVRKAFHSTRKDSIYYKGHKVHKNKKINQLFTTGKIGVG